LTDLHKRAAIEAFEHDQLLLPQDSTGLLEPENELERTWKISQAEIKQAVSGAAAAKGFELKLDQFGPYACDYTANGRYVFTCF
jgi:U3 small nucleolar RNA-associated protein 7